LQTSKLSMFEILKIILYGHQPAAKITNKKLEWLIQREFGVQALVLKEKLERLKGETQQAKNRNAAAILMLSNTDIDAIDQLIGVSNRDFRDVVARAEYPGCFELGFVDFPTGLVRRRQLYMADWEQYIKWIRMPSTSRP